MADEPIDIGNRREFFVDDALVERLVGRAELRLHQLVPQEIALETNESWEGNATNYVTVFQDGEKYRMYSRGSHYSYLGGQPRTGSARRPTGAVAIRDQRRRFVFLPLSRKLSITT